jgi:hypothetical protein
VSDFNLPPGCTVADIEAAQTGDDYPFGVEVEYRYPDSGEGFEHSIELVVADDGRADEWQDEEGLHTIPAREPEIAIQVPGWEGIVKLSDLERAVKELREHLTPPAPPPTMTWDECFVECARLDRLTDEHYAEWKDTLKPETRKEVEFWRGENSILIAIRNSGAQYVGMDYYRVLHEKFMALQVEVAALKFRTEKEEESAEHSR